MAKLNAISDNYQAIKEKTKKEEERIHSDNSDMIAQSNEHENSRDDIQADIYKLQNELRIIKSKRVAWKISFQRE